MTPLTRYPKQPWLIDAADLRPQGQPEVQYFTRQGDVFLGMYITGQDDTLLCARWNGEPVSLAIGAIAEDSA